jgi:beta-lactamase regulating signal transducer with metallopeptidase domain/putative intracellular protease/amidase
MTDLSIPPALVCFSLRLLAVLLSVIVKTSILLVLAFALQRIMKNASPRLRHALWLSSIFGCLLILVLSLAGPLFQVAPRPSNAAGPVAALSSALLPSSGSFLVQRDLPLVDTLVWRETVIRGIWPGLWPPLLLSFLAAGALWGWLQMLRGRIRLAARERQGRSSRAWGYDRSLRELSRLVGIRREIRVMECAGALTPLTHGILRPVIILPPALRAWPADRVRSVLLHELCHVKRGDSVTMAVAYWICSFLWFVPFIWPAYSRLHVEQEKECDAAVVRSGVLRQSYAACVLDAAQLCREPALLAGLSFSGRRKKVLEDRIRAIVRGGKNMKKGGALFMVSVFLLAATVFLSAAGTEGKGKVLMLLRDGNAEAADFMLSQEAAVMKLTLENAGYLVVVATLSGGPAQGSSMSLKADMKMADVQAADYMGFIVPCMAAGESPIPAESVAILKRALAAKKPIAAQNSAVLILNQAGGTRGKRFAIEADLASAVKDGTYGGIGVVRDGNLVTSGTCPLMAAQLGKPDGTAQLARDFIALLN